MSPGLPYDEPSHWSNVLFYADHGTLPILGHATVTYEAQQGPLAYVLDAIIVYMARSAGASASTAFHAIRLLGVLELAGLVLVIVALIRRLIPSPRLYIAATAVLALNPMLLAMSASVQNDTLAVLLGCTTLLLAVTHLREHPRTRDAGLVGVVAGLAVLTKLTALAAVAGVLVWLRWKHRREGLKPTAVFLLTVAAVSGWWFVRNTDLYGDPTAAAGVKRLGISYPPYDLHNLSGVGQIIEEIVTYLWLPTEYVRNSISASTVLKGALLAATVVIVGVGTFRWRRLGHGRSLVLACAVIALVGWLVSDLAAQATPPRIAYLALPAWIALVALTIAFFTPRIRLAAIVALLLALNVWTLHAINGVRTPINPSQVIAAGSLWHR